MKCLLLVLSAVLLPFCGFAGRFAPNPVSERRCITASEMRILFSDGVPQFEIVIPRNAPPAAKFAAEELAKHLGKVLGCQLEILNILLRCSSYFLQSRLGNHGNKYGCFRCFA